MIAISPLLIPVVCVFSTIYRPAIFSPSFSLSYFILLYSLFCLFLVKYSPRRLSHVLKPSLVICYVSILLLPLLYDLTSNQLFAAGLRGMFPATLRFFLYMITAYVFNFYIAKSIERVVKSLWLAAFSQVLLATLMLVVPGFKRIVFTVISNYNPNTSKALSAHFLDVRGFGWSAELFYLAPVATAIILSILNPYKKLYVLGLLLAILYCLVNSRISIVGFSFIVFYYIQKTCQFFATTYKDLKLKKMMISYLIVGMLAIIAALFIKGMIGVSTNNQVLDGILNGLVDTRSLNTLIDYYIVLPDSTNLLFGSAVYTFGSLRSFTSDIGFIILLHYGGVFLLLAWSYIFYRFGKFNCFWPQPWFVLAYFSTFILLGFKGLIFSGNSLTFLLLLSVFASRMDDYKSVFKYSAVGVISGK